MEIFWAIFASIVLALILWGIISSKIRARRPVSFGGHLLPKIENAICLQREYHIVINSGARFDKVRMLGFAEAVSGPESQVFWSSRRWLVLEHENGKRSFINPYTIRYFQEL